MKARRTDESDGIRQRIQGQTHVPSERSRTVCRSLHCWFKGNQEKISEHMGICQDTLRKHYRDILDSEIQSIDESVEQSLHYQIMVLRNVAATIFYLKTRMPHKYSENKPESEYNKSELLSDIKKLLPK